MLAKPRVPLPPPLVFAMAVICLGCSTGCERRPATRAPRLPVEQATAALDLLTPTRVGRGFSGRPWITHVNPCDLDRDGQMDVLACDATSNEVVWLRQTAPRQFEEVTLAGAMSAPVHIEPADLDGDGDWDLLVACMGQVLPNNDRIGSIIALENDSQQQFTARVLLENVARVTDVRPADFDGDGQLDLAVAQFGYHQGEVRWMRRSGPWSFESEILLDLPGAINVCVADLDGDATSDIVALVSQQSEEIHLFANDGRGTFTRKRIWGSTNQDYGSSGISLCDVNDDGRPDVLYTNGDGFDYATPGARPWHGVQWLENQGGRIFRYHRIGDLPGAYSPVGVDLDADGDKDVVAVSGFANWEDPAAVALIWFENDGHEAFVPRILAHRPTHLMTLAAADLDGTGQPVLITGALHLFPPFDRMSRVVVWRRAAAAGGSPGSQ